MAKITARTPSQIIAAIAHLLGFHPTESLVVVPINGNLPLARVDFPRDAMATLSTADTLANAYANRPGSVALVVFTSDTGEHAQATIEVIAAAMPKALTIALQLLTNGTTWIEPTTGGEGHVSTTDVDLIAAETAYAGIKAPVASREHLADQFTRTNTIHDDDFNTAVTDMAHHETTDQTIDAATAIINTARTTQLPLSTTETVRLLCLAPVPRWAEANYLPTTHRTHARADLAMWLTVAQRCPAPIDRTRVLELFAFNAWLVGDGATAWTALDHAKAEGEPSELSTKISALLTSAADPNGWNPGH